MREGFGNSVGSRESLLEVVETVSDSDIFHDIALVKDIRSSRRNDDVDLVFGSDGEVFASVDRNEIATLLRSESLVTHLLKEGDNLGARKSEAGARVDVGSAGDEGSRDKGRGKKSASSSSASFFVDDLDGFDTTIRESGVSELRMKRTEQMGDSHERFGTVLGEHGDDHVNYEIEFGSVGSGDIDEDVLSVESDLGVIRVDLFSRRRVRMARSRKVER